MAEGTEQKTAPRSPERVGGSYRYSNTGDSAAVAPEPAPAWVPPLNWPAIWIAVGLAIVCVGMMHPWGLRQLVDRWSSDSGWSHGFVVPLIALYFVWLKWDTLKSLAPRRSMFGLAVLMIGVTGEVLFRATGLLHMSGLSMVLVLMGLVLFVFGWEHMKLLWLPLSYLGFSIPPPTPLYVAVTTPMQMIAAEMGVILFPVFGVSGARHGTVIDIMSGSKSMTLNIAQACSGMRMLIAFFALAVALAYSTNRPVWQKIFLAACALPIAIFCNGLRVTLTGVIAVNAGQQWAEGKPHEFLGILMLGPAMILQLLIGWVLDRIFVEAPNSHSKAGGAV